MNYENLRLDLGIGLGGSYLTKDAKMHVTRIGADVVGDRLQKVKDRYGVRVCLLDANILSSGALPFASEIFDGVDIFMPHNSLLMNLADSTSGLWEELHRILKPTGSIDLVFDVQVMDYTQIRTIRIDGALRILTVPQVGIDDAATKAGFCLETDTLTSRQLKVIGTRFSNIKADNIINKGNIIAFEVKAFKIE